MNISRGVRTHANTKVDLAWREVLPAGCGPSKLPSETFLLIPGVGSTMFAFEHVFMQALADATQCRVIAMDNRDVGKSTFFAGQNPWLFSLLTPTAYSPAPAYTLHDMADDAWALLDSLKIAQAHVAGTSMGGMIASLCAAKRPEQTLSLTMLFSSLSYTQAAGGLSGTPLWVRYNFLTNNPPRNASQEQMVSWKTSFIDHVLMPLGRTEKQRASDMSLIRARALAEAAHSMDRSGGLRQTAAILHSPDATVLQKLGVFAAKKKTLIVSGSKDNIFAPDHHQHIKNVLGKQTEELILEHAGHYLERQYMDVVIKKIAGLVQKKE